MCDSKTRKWNKAIIFGSLGFGAKLNSIFFIFSAEVKWIDWNWIWCLNSRFASWVNFVLFLWLEFQVSLKFISFVKLTERDIKKILNLSLFWWLSWLKKYSFAFSVDGWDRMGKAWARNETKMYPNLTENSSIRLIQLLTSVGFSQVLSFRLKVAL